MSSVFKVLVREGDRSEARLLVTLRPNDNGVVVTEVIEEGEIEGDVVRLVVVPDLLRPVAVSDGHQKLYRGRE